MFKDHNSNDPQVQRPSAVPKLNLGILAGTNGSGQSSQKSKTPQQETRFAIPSGSGSNTKTPNSARHHPHPPVSPLMASTGIKRGETRATPPHTSFQRSDSSEGASKNYLGRTKSNDSAGNLTARQHSYNGAAYEAMTPRGGSYRDILLTPRGTRTEAPLNPLSRQAPPPHSQASTPKLLSPTTSSATKKTKNKETTQKPTQPKEATSIPVPVARSPPAPADSSSSQSAHHRTLSAQTERAAHEQDHVALQISTIQTTISAQQDALMENLAAAHSLAERRDALSTQAIELQAALSRARQATATRRAECEEAEVTLEALKASLEIASAEEAAGAANAAAARSSLLRIMCLAAKSLNLGGVSRALDAAASDPHATLGGGGAAMAVSARALNSAVCTARSEMSTSRFDTPTARSVAEDDSARSAFSDSSASDHTAEGSPVAPKAPVGVVTKLPPVTLPRLQLPGTIPAILAIPAPLANNNNNNISAVSSARTTSRVSPAALARLASIRNKLSQAESILSARIVVQDE